MTYQVLTFTGVWNPNLCPTNNFPSCFACFDILVTTFFFNILNSCTNGVAFSSMNLKKWWDVCLKYSRHCILLVFSFTLFFNIFNFFNLISVLTIDSTSIRNSILRRRIGCWVWRDVWVWGVIRVWGVRRVSRVLVNALNLGMSINKR